MDVIEQPVASRDGHASRLRLHGAGPGAPGLLWLPALGVPAHKYDPLARALAARGIRSAVHEWRGIGSSSLRARRGVDWGYRELLRHDLDATVAALPGGGRWVFGGHSLGGQLAAMAAARDPDRCAGLVLVATGVPRADAFRGRQRLGVGLFAHSLPALTALAGYYPGHRLGFAGRESGGVMRDWARTVRSGRYHDYGDGEAMDHALARLQAPVLALRMSEDWLVPEAALQALLEKLGPGPRTLEHFDAARLGARADHFRWMREPAAVADCIAAWMRGEGGAGLSP